VIEQGGLDVLETRHADHTHRRWPWVAAVVGVVLIGAGVVVVPKVTAHAAKDEVASVARVWAVHDGLDGAREGLLNRVLQSSTPKDIDRAHAAATAVTVEAADRVAGLQRQLDRLHLWRGEAKRLRAHASQALQAEQEQLRAATGSSIAAQIALPDGAVADQITQVTSDLARARQKFGVSAIDAPDQQLSAASAFLATMSHFLDDPPADRLVVFDGDTTHLLNLRTSSDDENPPLIFKEQNGSAVAEGLTVLEGVHATVVPSRGQPYRLPGATAFTGPRAGTLWVVREAQDGLVQQVAVTDPHGRLLGSWHVLPHGTVPLASTRTGLLLRGFDAAGSSALSTYDPLSGRQRLISRTGYLLGATKDLVVIARGATEVDIMSLDGRVRRRVDVKRDVQFAYNCCLGIGGDPVSPDQRWLALTTIDRDTHVAGLTMFDLHTGRFRTTPGVSAIIETGSTAWAPDSRQVFFATGNSSWPVGRYVIGAAEAEYLRWAGTEQVDTLAVLPGA
jgi:hypothetical protein